MHHPLVRMPLFLLGLGVLWACDDSTTLVLEPNPAIRIVIDSSRCPFVTRCGRCQLEFDAFDKNSQPVTILTVVWTSSNPDVATVDALGRVDGWAVGFVTVQAEVLETGATDDAMVQVVPPSNPAITCTRPMSLAGSR